MNSKSWCNIRNQINMSGSRFLILTLILSIVWTSGALANDQRSKLSSLSDATAEKLQQNKLNNKHSYIDLDDDFEGSGRKGEVQHALENEDDNDESGSGGFGDDEDDDRKPMRNEKPHLNKPDQTSNTHHSGDGSDHRVDSESTDDEDEEDYNENHEDQTSLNNQDIYFANSTDTEKPLSPTTTDEEHITESRPKEQYPNRGNDPFDTDPSHVVPFTPTEATNSDTGVLIMNTSNEDRTTSFFAQPGILAAVIGGAVVGLLFAILVVMFIVYRMRKKDEGSYALDEPQKRSPQANSYTKNHNNREFYA